MGPELIQAVQRVLPDVIRIRHRLHAYPELAGQEHRTAALIRRVLRGRAVSVLPPFLETDVVALLKGSRRGANVTLRADMDALPLAEQTGRRYRSKHNGVMHACGHDGHMAMLLGAALVLRRMRERLRGSVRFVFQPGEEVVAYGRELVASGALRNPAPKAVLALHAWDRLPVGTIAAKPGLSMAAADVFRIGVHGKGGHGSRPEACVNPVLVAAGIVRDLQRIPVFRAGRREPLVMSICRLAGGTNANVVPGTAEIEGSVRYLRVARSPALRRMVEKVIRSACLAAGATYELAYRSAYIPTVNTAWLVRLGRRVARRELGPQRWQDLVSPTMGSEDFAFYLKRHPGAIYRLGMGQDSPPLHSAAFDFNDGALQHGILFLVAMTLAIQSGGQARWRGRDSWQASTSMAR